MNASPNRSAYPGSNSTTSTFRPRNARLISYADDDIDLTGETQAISSSLQSETPRSRIRRTSKSPRPGPAGSIAASHAGYNSNHQIHSTLGQAKASNNGLWDSWSSIQGIASSLLGSEVQHGGKSKNNNMFKQPAWLKQGSSKGQPQWGIGSKAAISSTVDPAEERKALVDAKKREALLLACASESKNVTGNYKRKTSNGSLTYPDVIRDQDALVYLHWVQSQDTLAGVMIKYNCQPDVFRRVNRFWPNDNIQTRTHVLLPVEACSLRGRKVEGPNDIDLLSSELSDASIAKDERPPPNDDDQTPSTPQALSPATSPPSALENLDLDYQHDSWVLLPSFPAPTQIIRIPQRTLGYFPRARRKSNTNTDTFSTTSTPKSSFDMLRHPPTHAAQQTAAQAQASLSLNASPVRRPRLSSQLSRQRSSSTTIPTQSFASILHGPGSIGSLRGLRTEPAIPGAPEDPLNKKFAQYFPDLAPPEEIPRSSLRPRATPRPSTDSTRSNTSNNPAQAFGETLEGWVRKMTSPGPQRAGRSHVGNPGRMGDLIELEDTSDFGDMSVDRLDEEGETTPRPENLEFSAAAGGIAHDLGRTQASQGMERNAANGLNTEEELLNERFPIRGRIRTAYERGASRKDD